MGRLLALLVFIAAVGTGCAPARGDPTGASAAHPDVRPELAGKYMFTAQLPGVNPVSGSQVLTVRGDAYDLDRIAVNGDRATGFGLQIDNVLGAVIVPYPRRFFAAMGVAVYRVEGGSLKGFRLPEIEEQGLAGREELTGPPGLDGRYQITLNENPYGQPYYAGYVDIARYGEAYRLHWYTPELAYVGAGVRLGDVFVAAFSRNEAPGVVAYCVGHDWLVGIGGRGDRATLSTQTMRRPETSLPPPVTGRPSSCP